MKKILKKIFIFLCRVMPHKKTIIFESGDNFFDNGFVFGQYIRHLSEFKNYKLIFVGKKIKNYMNSMPKGVKYYQIKNKEKLSLTFLKYSYQAKYIFYSYDNYWRYILLPKKTKIFYINHGAFPVKNVKAYFDSMFDNFNHYYFLCTTSFVEKTMADNYPKPNVTYFLSGMPRCDLLLKTDEHNCLKQLAIKQNVRVIMVACTFRSFYKNDSMFFENEFPLTFNHNELDLLNNKLAEHNIVLLFKLHHAQKCSVSNYHYSNMLFVTNDFLENAGLNNYDLFNISSAMITDYSSIFIDYLLVNKPIGFVISDEKSYSTQRGFTLDNFQSFLPGKHIVDKKDFMDFIFKDAFDQNAFYQERQESKKLFAGEYSNNCESLLEAIKKL